MNANEVRKLTRGSITDAMEGAQEAITDPDRNVRVAAIRVIESVSSRPDCPPAAEAKCAEVVLTALDDPKRRVRWNAARAAGRFLDHAGIVARLQDMTEDASEIRKIRFTAFFQLSDARVMPEPAVDAIKSMIDVPKYRQTVLLVLLRAELTDSVQALLQEYVRGGTRDEAVLATRALCGYQIVNIQSLDPTTRQRLRPEDRAFTSPTWWWIRRGETTRDPRRSLAAVRPELREQD